MPVIKFAAAAFGALTIMASGASAATCSASMSNSITSSADCFIGSVLTDTVDAVNADGVFGATDYVLLAQDVGLNGTETGDAGLFAVTGNVARGTIGIAQSVFDMYGTVSLVLTAPSAARINPAGFVAYLLTGTGPFGYSSPFTQNNRPRDLTRVSLYAAAPVAVVTPSIVPLPASALLLGGALFGLGGLRRRRAARRAA